MQTYLYTHIYIYTYYIYIYIYIYFPFLTKITIICHYTVFHGLIPIQSKPIIVVLVKKLKVYINCFVYGIKHFT